MVGGGSEQTNCFSASGISTPFSLGVRSPLTEFTPCGNSSPQARVFLAIHRYFLRFPLPLLHVSTPPCWRASVFNVVVPNVPLVKWCFPFERLDMEPVIHLIFQIYFKNANTPTLRTQPFLQKMYEINFTAKFSLNSVSVLLHIWNTICTLFSDVWKNSPNEYMYINTHIQTIRAFTIQFFSFIFDFQVFYI